MQCQSTRSPVRHCIVTDDFNKIITSADDVTCSRLAINCGRRRPIGFQIVIRGITIKQHINWLGKVKWPLGCTYKTVILAPANTLPGTVEMSFPERVLERNRKYLCGASVVVGHSVPRRRVITIGWERLIQKRALHRGGGTHKSSLKSS